MEGKMTTLPKPLDDLLVKLSFLSKIEEGHKVNIVSKSFSQNTWVDSLTRMIHGESRDLTFKEVTSIFNDAFIAIAEYQNTNYLTKVVNYVYNARSGVHNLLTTYRDDPDISAKLEVLIDKINMQLEPHRSLLQSRK